MTEPSGTTGASRAEALLDQVALHALDDDYLHADPPQHPGRARFVTTAVVMVFGVVLSMAAVEAVNERPAASAERALLVSDIKQRQKLQASRRSQVTSLTEEVRRLQQDATGTSAQRSAGVRLASGSVAVHGPGVRITARSPASGDSVISDTNLQLLVNGLWYAGAEAVAINGERIGPTTSIRTAGEAITVNYRALTEPYVVSAIGGKDLAARWTDGPSGRYWAALRRASGFRYSVVTSRRDLDLPRVPSARLTLRHATVATSTSKEKS